VSVLVLIAWGSAPSALPDLVLWTSGEGVIVVTAISSIAHPWETQGARCQSFHVIKYICARKVFLCSITAGRVEE